MWLWLPNKNTAGAYAFPIAAAGTEGLKVFAASTGHIIATYQGNSTVSSNDLYLDSPGDGMFLFNSHASTVGSTVDPGAFAIGTEPVFRLHVNNTGYDYFTGPASRNPDGHEHARVQTDWQPDEALVSFEDLYNGPFVYNDLSFSFTNVAGADVAPHARRPRARHPGPAEPGPHRSRLCAAEDEVGQ